MQSVIQSPSDTNINDIADGKSEPMEQNGGSGDNETVHSADPVRTADQSDERTVVPPADNENGRVDCSTNDSSPSKTQSNQQSTQGIYFMLHQQLFIISWL